MADPRDPIHPQIAPLFELLKAGLAERVLKPEAMRASAQALGGLLSVGAPAVAREETLEIPGPAGALRARVFYPGPAEDGPYPAVVYFHGGGFVMMSPETHERLTRQLCVGARAVVVSVDYRLAPEHPYPAPIEDCLAAYSWVRDNAARMSADPARVAAGGDSAGGNAAVAVALQLKHRGQAPPATLLLLCPWGDMSLSSGSYRRFAPDDPVIDDAVMRFFRDSYLSGAPDEPLASPVRADLAGMPETLVVVGGIDPLGDDGLELARRIEAGGAKVELRWYPGMPHDFMLFPGLDDAERAVAEINAFARRVLGS